MRLVLRALAITVVTLLGLGWTQTADARVRLIDTDDRIIDLGVIPDELRELVAAEGLAYDHVGFFHERVAVFGADLWSWSGQLVFFRKEPLIEIRGLRTVETTYYVEIPDELADKYGWSTPIEYRIPVGLLVLACLIEFAIVARKKRRAKRVLYIGIGLVVFSAILFALGMTWQVGFPLLLGLFHIVTALPYFQPVTTAEAAAAIDDEPDPPFAPRPAPERASQLLPPPPSFEKDPFRAPPQPPPIQVERPPTTPLAPPVVRDENADAPKLLR